MGALVMLATFSASAICINPFGCAPANYEECIDDASKRPSDKGVMTARDACYTKFKAPENERLAREREQQAQAFAEKWRRIDGSVGTGEKLRAHLGKPLTIEGPATCSKVNGKSPSSVTTCMSWSWLDFRPGRICLRMVSGIDCYFTLEIENTPEQKLWAWWPESI